MASFQHLARDRPAFERARQRRFPGAAIVVHGWIARSLGGPIWLHRIAACIGIAGAMMVQACLLCLVARFLIGGAAVALPDLATCLYGLVIGAGMLGLRALAEAGGSPAGS